ncbi:alpha/beta hydrolase [Fulvivirga ligni]|uniref:alpha/beta hydrolase n=1 Tax=Fulvivirga ligni TaxID=2904246 RepID=UPI001F203777|nr:hypothetical protein [Fulvivirga ligni]UII23089.1 hypothetical protein LVD16_07610 [Fulvivirga ligni]
MEQKRIKFGFSARYFQQGELNSETKQIIFLLHGYGQQAKYFIRKFQILENPYTCLIAPEGLSKFYLQGFSGRVGATWMTKEDRLNDIDNYINYLNEIYSTTKEQIGNTSFKISVIGFSQGAATVSRWVVDNQVPFDKIILWAGVFPPDMDFEKASEVLQQKEIHYVYGLSDQFISEERLEEMRAISQKLGISPKVLTFDGEHDIDQETLGSLF